MIQRKKGASFEPMSTSTRLVDRRAPVLSPSKVQTMHATLSNNSTATTGKAEPSRFVKTDMPMREVASKVAEVASAAASVRKVAMVAVLAAALV